MKFSPLSDRKERPMRKLPIMTAMMGFILVLVSPLAFSVDVVININENGRCTFIDPENPTSTIVIDSPDSIKLVTKWGARILKATCEDEEVVTSGKAVVFEDYYDSKCRIQALGDTHDDGSYKQTSNKNGSKLTCEKRLPGGF